jgi:uncharacterized protein YidB (DUF937 family)
MKTHWMLKGTLLTVVTLVLLVASGWAGVAAQNAGTPTPEAVAPAQDSIAVDIGGCPFGDELDGADVRTSAEDCKPLNDLAGMLGISGQTLWEALTAGQSLSEIAAANGVTRQELVDALTAQADAHLDWAAGREILDGDQTAFIREWLADGTALVVDHPLPVGQDWAILRCMDWRDLLDAQDYDLPERLATTLDLTLQELASGILQGRSLAAMAAEQGVDPATVVGFLTSEVEQELDEAGAEGYLTQAQVQLLRGWAVDGVEAAVDNSLIPPNSFELLGRLAAASGQTSPDIDWEAWGAFDWSRWIGRDPVSTTATTLGISRGEMLEQLSAGKSLASIAAAQGVDVAEVETALTASVQAMLDDMVSAGLLPAAEAEQLTQSLEPAISIITEYGFPFAALHGPHAGSCGD